MSYSTKEDILKQISQERLIELTDDEGIGQFNESVISEAIEDADSRIDTYCGTVYTVPFSPVPEILKRLSVDIAIYNLFSRRGIGDEVREKRYDNAIRLLKEISTGKVTLGKVPEPKDNPERRAQLNAQDRIFNRDTMKDL